MEADDPPPVISPLVLRPYQTEAIDACVGALETGKRRIGVSSPTGSGKTTMFMKLITEVPDTSRISEAKEIAEDEEEGPEITELREQGRGGQVLIVVSGVQLAAQAEEAARRILGPEYTVEVEQGKRVATGYADV